MGTPPATISDSLPVYRAALEEAHRKLLALAGPLWIDEGEPALEIAAAVRQAAHLHAGKLPAVAEAVLALLSEVQGRPLPEGWQQKAARSVEAHAQATVLLRSAIYSLESVGPLAEIGLHEAAWVRATDAILWSRFYLESQLSYARALEARAAVKP